MEHNSGGWTGLSDPGQIGRAEYFQQATRTNAGVAAGKLRGLWFLLLFGVLVIGAMIAGQTTGKAYPACDNTAAREALARLYDNRRLLHATGVSDVRQLSDGVKGRYCSAIVKWASGSETEVHYEFYRSGGQNRYVSMRID
jgi:hypothetical protein